MKKFTADVFVNKNKPGKHIESPHIYGCVNDAFKAAQAALYEQHRQPGGSNWWSVGLKEVEGDTVTVNVRIVLKCAMNRIAKRRAPEVIAAEKAAKLVKQQARAEEDRKREELPRRCVSQNADASRSRFTTLHDRHQSGSEPASKYITCDQCSGPADFIYVNTALAPGAAVLDENTITDAVCALHNYATNQWRRQYDYKHVAEIVPCSRLEFFYTGIRQIAIKAKTS